jgi:hypothetical protein
MSRQQTVVRVTATPRPAKQALPAAGVAVQRLKAERVQEEAPARLALTEVRLGLPPGWRLAAKGRALERVRDLGTQEKAVLYGNFVTASALAAGVSARVSVAGTEAAVLLYTARPSGHKRALSESVLGFAWLLG